VAALGVDDNDIPGAPLPSSPVTGTLNVLPETDPLADLDDVYSVYLAAGETFSARLTGPTGTEFTFWLYGPEAKSVYAETPGPIALSDEDAYPAYLRGAADAKLSYTAAKSGMHYLDVLTMNGAGTYTLEWAKGVKPTAKISSSRTIDYGTSTVLSGSVLSTSGAPLPGQRVELFADAYPYTAGLRRVGTVWTRADGTYRFTVKPTVTTEYRAVASVKKPGYAFAESAVSKVGVKPKITRANTSSSITHGRKFKIWGTITPKHTNGKSTVYVYAYKRYKKSNGTYAYAYKKKIKTTNYTSTAYPSRTRYYTKSATLPSAGKWKLVAKSADDGKHAAAKASSRYVWVK
jgi:hypothetical protein